VTVKLYMDEHVPKAITLGLRLRSVDVLTTEEDDRRGLSDAALLARASELGRAMFSFDVDMLREAADRQRKAASFAGLIYAHPAQITIGQVVRDLELIAKLAEPAELAGKVIFLPL